MALKRNGGYSLIELVITLVIVSVLGLSLWPVVSLAFDTWNSFSTRKRLVQEGRVAMERITREARNGIWTGGYNNFNNDTASNLEWDDQDGTITDFTSVQYKYRRLRFLSGPQTIDWTRKQKNIAAPAPSLLAGTVTTCTFRYLDASGNPITTPKHWFQTNYANTGRNVRLVEITLTLTRGGESYTTRSKVYFSMRGIPRDQHIWPMP